MATMRDVAKLAGVSHGTVSNVLNGSNGVTLDKIKRVEDAMRQLGYKPNSLARSLKNNKVERSIQLIIPDLTSALYSGIYNTISRAAEEENIRMNLSLTGDIPYRERKALLGAQTYAMGGAIVVTSCPGDLELFSQLQQDGVRLVFLLRRVPGQDFVGLETKKMMRHSVSEQIKQGARKIAIITGPQEYSYEAECIDGYFNAMFASNFPIQNEYVKVADSTKEGFMRAANALMNGPARPDVIYVTDDKCADGVRQAISMACAESEPRPHLVLLGGGSWSEVTKEETVLALPGARLGELALSRLMSKFEAERDEPPLSSMIEAQIPPQKSTFSSFSSETPTIRVLLQTGKVGDGVCALMQNFQNQTGIKVEAVRRKYNEMLETIEDSHGEIDAFCSDLAWAPEMNNCGYAEPLEPYMAGQDIALDAFENNIMREYCYYHDKLYALPYSYTAQMLFYRKDLFESLKNKRHFYETYKKDLHIPRTWEEYNQVARFFTKKYNPKSETKYGTTMGCCEYNGAVCEYLPRMWAFAGTKKDGDWISLNSKACVDALKNYVECFDYAPPESLNWWWDEEAACFEHGDSAMMVLFFEHAAYLWERGQFPLSGKIGHSAIPGGTSLLGGWSIAIHSESQHKKEAFEFIKWSSCIQLARPSVALGRILPYQAIRDDAELTWTYPWLNDAFRACNHVGRRYLPEGLTAVKGLMPNLERTIGNALRAAIRGEETPEGALQTVKKEMQKLI